MFLTVYLFVLSICVFFIEKRWKLWILSNGKRNINPPELSRRLPFIGHAHLFIGDSIHLWKMAKWISMESVKKGGLVTISFGPKKVYAVTDPVDIATLANVSLEKSYIYDFSKPWLGGGLFTTDARTWKHHRKMLNPAFKQPILDGFIQAFNEQGKRLVEDLAPVVNNEKFDVLNYLALHSLRTVFKTILGVSDIEVTPQKFNSYLETNNVLHQIFTERFQKFWLHSDYIFNRTKTKVKQDLAVDILHGVTDMVLQKRKALRKVTLKNENHYSDDPKPFIDLLLDISEDQGFSDANVIHELATFIAAGHDTVPYILLYTLICIGSYPKVQERVYDELEQTLGSDDVTKQNLSSLVYLEATIKETLRLYPIAPMVSRITDSEVQLRNYTIPSGASVALCYWGLHHHSVWGPQPELFNPERWLHPNLVPENAFAGFSTGKRNCIGKPFAMMSMKASLALLLRQYQVTADISTMEAKLDIILKPASNHWIKLENRTKL